MYVSQVLNSNPHQQSIDDEGPQTLFCEVEATLNNCPLSTMSSKPHEPWTPNHIFLLKTKPILLPETLLGSDLYARSHWKQVQLISSGTVGPKNSVFYFPVSEHELQIMTHMAIAISSW